MNDVTLHDITLHHMRKGQNSGQTIYLLWENMVVDTEFTCFTY